MNSNDLFISYGNDPKTMVMELMDRSKVLAEIGRNASVGIKPNLVLDRTASSGATTTPAIVEGIIAFLLDGGIRDISIMESSWVGCDTKDAIIACGYDRLSREYGIPIIDLKEDATEKHSVEDLAMSICRRPLQTDFLINVPVLKGHCQTQMTCALKNLKGCIPDREKRRFHRLGLHAPIACLNKILKQHLIVVDGLMGDLSFEEGGTPVPMDRIIIGRDPVLVDSYAADLIGFNPESIEYITRSAAMGVGYMRDENTAVTEFGEKPIRSKPFAADMKLTDLRTHIKERDACSACYGTLLHALYRLKGNGILKDMKDLLYVGQGWVKRRETGIGIGDCTRKFKNNIPGCPPKARDIILKLLEKMRATSR